MRLRILLTAALTALLILLVGAPALASDSLVLSFTEGETESEVVEEQQGSELGIEPAVEAPVVAETEDDRPWTQRFLAPAVLALGVLGLIGATLFYGVRLRGKYRVAS